MSLAAALASILLHADGSRFRERVSRFSLPDSFRPAPSRFPPLVGFSVIMLVG